MPKYEKKRHISKTKTPLFESCKLFEKMEGRLEADSGPGKKMPIFPWETNQPTHRGSSVAGSQVTMPRSKSLGRLARILPRIGARWFHVTWNDWKWGKNGGELYGICDDNWGERYSRWPGVSSFVDIIKKMDAVRALACPLEWAWGAKANDATCWDSFLHGSRDDQCGYLWPESRCLDGRVQCQMESDQKFRTIIDTIRPSCIILQPLVVLLLFL